MKCLRDFKFGNKQLCKGAEFEEKATPQQKELLKKYKFICPSKKEKKQKVENGSLSEDTK